MQGQVQLKRWVYGHTACLTRSDRRKRCIYDLRPCAVGWGRGGCLRDLAARRESCEDEMYEKRMKQLRPLLRGEMGAEVNSLKCDVLDEEARCNP